MPTASVTVKIPISLEIIAAIRAGHFDHQEGTLSDGAADLSLTALGYTISAVKALPNHPMLRPAEESFELQIRDTEGRVILVPVQVTSKITVKELARRVSKLTGLLTKQMFLLHKGEKIFNGAEEQHPDAHLADLHSVSAKICSCRWLADRDLLARRGLVFSDQVSTDYLLEGLGRSGGGGEGARTTACSIVWVLSTVNQVVVTHVWHEVKRGLSWTMLRVG